MERGDFTSLPGEFYTRAFLRTYAAHLGISPQAILDDYESEHPPAQQAPAVEPAWQNSVREASSQLVAAVTSTGVVVVLVVALLAVAVANRPDAPRRAEPGAVGTAGDAASSPAPARTPAAVPSAPAAPQQLTIEIQAVAPLWVTGAADGRRVLYRLLAPGERVTVNAAETLAFRVGDASAFTYSINGVPGKPLGAAGEVRDLEINRQNYRSFAR